MHLVVSLLFTFFLIHSATQAQPAEERHEQLDVQHYSFELQINDNNDMISGKAVITVLFLKNCTEFRLDLRGKDVYGKGMTVSGITEDRKPLYFRHGNDGVRISTSAIAGDRKSYTIAYTGIPADGLIIARNRYGNRTIFSDNWPDRARNWIPCIDHPIDKSAVDFTVTAPEHYQVISNGIKVEETNLDKHMKRTTWKEVVPLPTKVMVIGLADFAVNYAGDVDCIPLYSWVYPQDRDNGFYDFGLAREILPWFIKNVGPYAYRKLANVQSTTRFGGMENASAIFYSEHSLTGDRKAEALITHEIAHQWFGNSATEKSWNDIWLSEGFATYMTQMFLEDKYGSDTLNKRMRIDRDTVVAYSKRNSRTVVPTGIDERTPFLDANSYEKAGWVLHMLRKQLGDEIFWKGIQKYYAVYNGKNASTADFRVIMEKVSGKDLNQFFRQWLYTSGQPELDVSWTYDKLKRTVTINITQSQATAFSFPLEIQLVAAKQQIRRSVMITAKTTTAKISSPVEPSAIQLDPDVHLLFSSKLKSL